MYFGHTYRPFSQAILIAKNFPNPTMERKMQKPFFFFNFLAAIIAKMYFFSCHFLKYQI